MLSIIGNSFLDTKTFFSSTLKLFISYAKLLECLLLLKKMFSGILSIFELSTL